MNQIIVYGVIQTLAIVEKINLDFFYLVFNVWEICAVNKTSPLQANHFYASLPASAFLFGSHQIGNCVGACCCPLPTANNHLTIYLI